MESQIFVDAHVVITFCAPKNIVFGQQVCRQGLVVDGDDCALGFKRGAYDAIDIKILLPVEGVIENAQAIDGIGGVGGLGRQNGVNGVYFMPRILEGQGAGVGEGEGALVGVGEIFA